MKSLNHQGSPRTFLTVMCFFKIVAGDIPQKGKKKNKTVFLIYKAVSFL